MNDPEPKHSPLPINPGEGWRLLAAGEPLQPGDGYFHPDFRQWLDYKGRPDIFKGGGKKGTWYHCPKNDTAHTWLWRRKVSTGTHDEKHSPPCQCENCQHFEREYAKLMASNSDMRSVLAFHASVTAPEPEHWIIKLAREVAGTPGARAALNSSFVYCVRDLVFRDRMDDVRAAVAALAEAEAILEGKM